MATRQLKAPQAERSGLTKPKVISRPPGSEDHPESQFPEGTIIDTEGGRTLPQYQRKLAAADGLVHG